jgi:hypothetical protein
MLVSDLINETRRTLLASSREERNKLAVSIFSGSTGLTLSYPIGQVTRGTKLSIDLEDIYVWEASGLSVTAMERGQWGSTALNHSAGAVIYVNPKFSNWEIFNAINDEITSLSSPSNGLFQVLSAELTYNPVTEGYDLTGFSTPAQYIQDVIEVRYKVTGPGRQYPLSTDWELSRSMSDEFTAGMALFVRDAFPNQPIIVKGKFGFSELAPSMATDVSSSGMDPLMYDILTLGAAWRLTAGLETARNFSTGQGDTRRANEVPPGSNLGGSREYGRLREIRIREEASRLSNKYPARSPRYPFRVG